MKQNGFPVSSHCVYIHNKSIDSIEKVSLYVCRDSIIILGTQNLERISISLRWTSCMYTQPLTYLHIIVYWTRMVRGLRQQLPTKYRNIKHIHKRFNKFCFLLFSFLIVYIIVAVWKLSRMIQRQYYYCVSPFTHIQNRWRSKGTRNAIYQHKFFWS